MLDCGCLSHNGGVCVWELASSLASSAVPADFSIGSGPTAIDNNSSIPAPAPVLVCCPGSISLPTLGPNDAPTVITPTTSPQASPLSKPVHLSELSRCPVPPMSSTGSSSTQQHRQQQQHARPRPILPESTGSSGKQRRKRKAADDHNDWTHSNKRQTVFLPVGRASSSPPSKGEGSRNSHKRRPSSSSSRSRSPKSPRSSSPIIPTARVLTIAPTVRGISEAARILRISTNAAGTTCISRDTTSNTQEDEKLSTSSPRSITRALPVSSGILSFPTETVYTLSTCVRLRPHHHHQYQNAQTVNSSMGGKMNARSESVSSISSSSSSSSSSGGEASGRLGKEMDHTSLNIRK